MAVPAAPVTLTVVPPRPTHAESAEEQPYDRLDCPACGTIFRDLPDAVADCPACGSTIHVLTCPEGVRHLLTDADVVAFDDDWDALHATRRREEAQRRNAAALQARRTALASYGELGVRLVDLRTRPGACAAASRWPNARTVRGPHPDSRSRAANTTSAGAITPRRDRPSRVADRPRVTPRELGASQTKTPGGHWQADRSPGVSMPGRSRG